MYDNSTLVWYENPAKNKKENEIRLLDVEKFICIGKNAQQIPKRPKIDPKADPLLLVCFPIDLENKAKSICWLHFQDCGHLE